MLADYSRWVILPNVIKSVKPKFMLKKTIRRLLLSSLVLFCIGSLSRLYDILPGESGLIIFGMSVLLLGILVCVCFPISLGRFIWGGTWGTYSWAGLVAALPLLMLWLTIGPDRFIAPGLSDVSTDLQNPPAIIGYKTHLSPKLQQDAYPDLKGVTIVTTTTRMHDALSRYAEKNNWDVTEEIKGTRYQYLVETSLLRVRYLVTVRVKLQGGAQFVDIRCTSLDSPRDFSFCAETIMGLEDYLTKTLTESD